jgi:hypothetical protein
VILSVCHIVSSKVSTTCSFFHLVSAKIEEVCGPVSFIVEVFRVVEDQRIAEILTEVYSIEVVIPKAASFWNHKEAKELIG